MVQRPRAKPAQRYKTGEAARARILATATELFGELGYEGASTRQIAEQAGVALPALPYYFGGKEGLYLACAQQIADDLAAGLRQNGHSLAAGLDRGVPDPEEIVGLVGALVERVAEFWLGAEPAAGRVAFIIREQAHPTGAFEIIYGGSMKGLLELCCRAVGAVWQRPASDPVVRIRALQIMGAPIFFRVAHATTLRVMGWPRVTADRLDFLKGQLRGEVERGLRSGPPP